MVVAVVVVANLLESRVYLPACLMIALSPLELLLDTWHDRYCDLFLMIIISSRIEIYW